MNIPLQPLVTFNSGPVILRRSKIAITLSRYNIQPLQWVNKGQILLFNDPDRFATGVLPDFAFPPTTFKSFVRKMYRWGFWKVKVDDHAAATAPRPPHAFACDYFSSLESLRIQIRFFEWASVGPKVGRKPQRLTWGSEWQASLLCISMWEKRPSSLTNQNKRLKGSNSEKNMVSRLRCIA
jgi:HSF-type DNA-binding